MQRAVHQLQPFPKDVVLDDEFAELLLELLELLLLNASSFGGFERKAFSAATKYRSFQSSTSATRKPCFLERVQGPLATTLTTDGPWARHSPRALGRARETKRWRILGAAAAGTAVSLSMRWINL